MMKKAVMFLFIVVVLAGIGIYITYSKLQQHQEKREQYTQQLIQEQKQLIDEQRKQLKHVSDHLPEVKSEIKTSVNTKPMALSHSIQKPMPTTLGYFKCDGRTYCSQMHSLAEARWFVRNCPNTKMDGNHDGEPCESDSRRKSDPNWQ